MRSFLLAATLAVSTLLTSGCLFGGTKKIVAGKAELIEVATSQRQWTGVAVAGSRMFVNYPRWSADVPVSVAELRKGEPVPYPNSEWNSWTPGVDPATHFVCVQSVFVDPSGSNLWVVDAASPNMEGIVPGGPKLVQIHLSKGSVEKVYPIPAEVAPAKSYLNDVRIDLETSTAYLTDSGLGAIIVLDLKSGESRRLLSRHRSVKSEEQILTVGGKPWLRNGKPPVIHADGIALNEKRDYLYYQALTGKTLYRIPTSALRDKSMSETTLELQVESLGVRGVADGIEFGKDGNLYLSALEEDAVNRFTTSGRVETVVRDPRLAWPDSFAVSSDGTVYVTTSQIHLGPNPPEPYRIFKLAPQK